MSSKLKYLLLFALSFFTLFGMAHFLTKSYLENTIAIAPASSQIEVTSTNFETEVIKSTIPVYIEFYTSENCQACRKQQLVINKVAPEFVGKVKFVRINAAKEKDIAKALSLKSVPVHLFKTPNDKILAAKGLLDEAKLKEFLTKGLELSSANTK